jgi:hypothetical protein
VGKDLDRLRQIRHLRHGFLITFEKYAMTLGDLTPCIFYFFELLGHDVINLSDPEPIKSSPTT